MALIDALDRVYQLANGLVQEVKHRDLWVYCVSRGNLPAQGGELAVHYLGRKRFADDFLMFYDRDNVDAAVQQNIRQTLSAAAFWRRRGEIKACPPEADIFIVDRFFERSQDSEAHTLAPHLNAILQVRPTLEEQLELIRSKGHRRKLQSALNSGISWRRTHSLADFNLFYDTMYLPLIRERFRHGASVVPRLAMQRMFVQRGYLLLVEDNGVPVSGALIYTSRRDRGLMNYWKYGLADASTLPAKEFGERNAAQEACVLQHAVKAKYHAIDWGLTKAVPTDGIFAHKKRMGCDFQKTPNAPDFRIYINPKSRARFLTRFPLVVGHHGGLQAMCAHELPLSNRMSANALKELLSSASFPSSRKTVLYVPAEMTADPTLDKLRADETTESGTAVEVQAL